MWAAFALLCAGAASAATFGDEPGPLPWRIGGDLGFTADAATFPDSSGHLLEVYLRLRPATLTALARGQAFERTLRLIARIRPEGKGKVEQAQQTLTFEPADTVSGYGRVVQFAFRTRPGVHLLSVRAEGRRRLFGGGTGRPTVASVEGEILVPEPQSGSDLSDVEFVWSPGDSQTSRVFERGGQKRVPNPDRLYGLFENRARASFVARAKPGDERPWRWVVRLLDPAGRAIAVRESTGVASRWLHADADFDIASETSGAYALEVKAWHEGDSGALVRRARFSVGWHPDTWNRNPKDIEDEAHFLLSRDEEERFQRMMAGEQERYLLDFWKRRDPTPETAENEARDRFLERVHFANETYNRFGVEKGMFSDMGRVFIRYGEPNEVFRSVMPGKDNELERLIAQYVSPNDRPVGDIEDKQLGVDMRPFELWIYQGVVAPPPDADPDGRDELQLRKRLLFLFVDERGLGEFRLKYSTE